MPTSPTPSLTIVLKDLGYLNTSKQRNTHKWMALLYSSIGQYFKISIVLLFYIDTSMVLSMYSHIVNEKTFDLKIQIYSSRSYFQSYKQENLLHGQQLHLSDSK